MRAVDDVGPERSGTYENRAITKGFCMNIFRRMTGRLLKAIAASAVMVGAGLPVVLNSGAASAAATTGPTLYCSQYASTLTPMYNYQGTPYCGSMPYGTQNSTLTFNISAANLAFDLGTATATTNATGVTVTSVVENNQNSATVSLSIAASTAPGYYSLTLTDHNGTATLPNAFGVDPASTITSYTPKTISEGSTMLVTVTGAGLSSGTVTSDGSNGNNLSATSGVASPDGTSLTFYASAPATAALGVYSVDIAGANTTNAAGKPGIDITVAGAAINSISPSQFGHNTTATTVTQNMTITGTGFVAGAVVRVGGSLLPWQPFTGATSSANSQPEITFGTATVVNATTITVPVTIQTVGAGTPTLYNTTPAQWDVSVTNPDGTNYDAAGGIGWLEAGSAAYTSATVTMVTDSLTPGPSTVTLNGSPAFGLAAGDTVTLSYGPFSFTGTMTSSTTASFDLPQYLSTTLSQAASAGQTNIVVGNLAGITSQNLTFVDATGETVAASSETAVTSSVGLGAPLKYSHAAGTVVEFPIQSVTGWNLAVNNGSTTLNIVAGVTIGNTPNTSITYHRTDGTIPSGPSAGETWPVSTMNLAPGTYTMLATFPGANFATGAATISFATSAGANPDGITGTITPTNTNSAYVTITMPGTVSTPTYINLSDPLTATAPAASTTLYVNTTNAALTAGESIALDYGTIYQETVKIASVAGSGVNTTVTLTTPTTYPHALNGTVYSVTYAPSSTGTSYYATVNTGNGQLITTPLAFATTSTPLVGAITGFSFTGTPAASPGLVVGAGASQAAVNIFGTFNGSHNGADYVVTSSTPGVTFGAVTWDSTSEITAAMSVAAGTPVNLSVQVTVTEIDGNGSASVPTSSNPNSGLLIGNTPTITAVTGLPSSLIPGETATFSITGTLFDSATVSSLNGDVKTGFLADSGNLTGMLDKGSFLGHAGNGVSVTGCVLNSSTSITCSVTVNGGATNGAHDLTITNGSQGTATLANALTVSNATIGATSPLTYQSDNFTDTFTLTGLSGLVDQQGVGGTTPSYYATTYDPSGNQVDQYGSSSTYSTWAGTNAVTVTVPGNLIRPPGGYLVITLQQASSVTGTALSIDAQAISLGLPLTTTGGPVFAQPAGTSGSFAISAGNSTYGSPFNGPTTFMPGATVTVVSPNPAYVPSNPGITVSGVTVLPGLITGNLAVAGSVPSGTYDLVVTNPDGGIVYTTISVTAAPQVSAVNSTAVVNGPVSFLNGTSTTLNIAGTGFEAGLVVSASVPGDATFGTTTVNAAGTFLTVPVKFTSLAGGTPAVIDLIVTNPDGGTSTVAGELVITPQPTVTGTYYVPTFTTNTELVVSGTGFESGATVTSSNSAYTVSVANVTPTAATLLVSTTAAATAGTSTNVTLTNPDGGTVTFVVNGGPNPNTLPKVPKAFRTVGVAWTGRSVIVKVVGVNFYGGPKVTSNVAGVKVGVLHDNGQILTMRVTVAKTSKRGVHTFTIVFMHGQKTSVRYNQR